MTRRRDPAARARKLTIAAERIDTVMAMGFYVVEFSKTHYRIQDRIDFWPTTGKWSDRLSAVDSVHHRPSESGGFVALVAYLRENVPTGETETT